MTASPTDPLYCARIYTNGVLDFCTAAYPSRSQAIAALHRKRAYAKRCMTSEVRWNQHQRAMLPTHNGIEWHDIKSDPSARYASTRVSTLPNWLWKLT